MGVEFRASYCHQPPPPPAAADYHLNDDDIGGERLVTLGHHTSSQQGWLLGSGFCVFTTVSVCVCVVPSLVYLCVYKHV